MSSYSLLIISALFLVLDYVFSLTYFRFSYYIELKRRYLSTAKIPAEYKEELKGQHNKEYTQSRKLIFTVSLLIWGITTIIHGMWYVVPVIVVVDFLVQFISVRGYYMPPFAYYLKNLLHLSVVIFSVLNILQIL